MATPRCKPFRLIELLCILLGFLFLFFLRKYHPRFDKPVGSGLLICFFTCYGSLLILIGADVICQVVRRPISNAPMMEVLIFGAVSCLISAIFALVLRDQQSDSYPFRSVNVLSVLILISFTTSVIFILDLILIIRFA